MTQESAIPNADEQREFSLRAFKGIEVGLNKNDPGAKIAADLAAKYPDHLILVQAGTFLHAYDKSAHLLATLKEYKLQLVGTAEEQNLRVGFPASKFKRRLWEICREFDTPYVVALGCKLNGYTLAISDQVGLSGTLMDAVPETIVQDTIRDLQQLKEVNKAGARALLAKADAAGFKLKEKAKDFDKLVLQDIIKMPRDLRTTFGENLRGCMARLMRDIHAYGTALDKAMTLQAISTEIDLLKHYIEQAQGISRLKFSIEHRAALIVELGKLTGGLIRAQKE